ncbi:MAG TPA: hypothetical protein VN605_03405 [Thermoanaerobaculia bacterium]|nr:hypothetical protein [Thermoanaerobaculia bacterium]
MSVTEIGALHGRYVRLSDRFKSIWTYHQFAAGTYKNLLEAPLPYTIDFQGIYDGIKHISGMLNSSQTNEAGNALTIHDRTLDRATATILKADDRISASILRRFFEKLKRQDESIIHFLIKFYLYADTVEGDRRDKLDFLFTRIGEDYMANRGEYFSRESLEFREKIIALVSILHIAEPPQDEIVGVIRAIRSMRDEIQASEQFEDLTSRNLLRNARTFKHRVGDLYFHPDVLLAIVELNVSTKNRFLRLYHAEEHRIVEDSEKLLEHGASIERNFGDTNPELLEEIARFREYKGRFDELRAQSNVKHDVIARLKSSMSNILAQLDRGLGSEDEVPEELPPDLFLAEQQVANMTVRFGREDLLLHFLIRIATAIEAADPLLMADALVESPTVRELRLESWEASAYQKLFDRREPDADEDNDELWMLYLRAAALRVKVDEEATIMATAMAAGVRPEDELLAKAKASLDCAKELDEQFGEFLHEAAYYSKPHILHQLYRSRFRLLRGFSGLWLIYDRQS